MIQKCGTTTLTKKRFSEFELVDPSTKEDAERLYLAGYMEDEEGKKRNVKMHAAAFLNIKLGDNVPEVNPGDTNNAFSVIPDVYLGHQAQILTINYQSSVDFLQINKVADSMWTTIEGRQYLCIKMSPNYPLGGVFRLYFPNFPFDRGVALFPKSNTAIGVDEPVEVFYCQKEKDQEKYTQFDFYVTLIQLADPTTSGGEEIIYKTKVISVMNIEDFDE